MKQFKIFQTHSNQMIHGITTKPMGSFDDDINFGTSNMPIFGNQIHGDNIIILGKYPDQQLEGDAFVTNKLNIPLAVKIADCQGILVFDPINTVIAVIHSGWRGSTLNIIGKTIKKMSDEFGSSPSDLLVGISPSLGPCCAEFSDPENELPEFLHPYIKDRNVNFWSLSIDQLKKAGVPEGNIELMSKCTKCNSSDYFSHRNGDVGRMGVFIEMCAPQPPKGNL